VICKRCEDKDQMIADLTHYVMHLESNLPFIPKTSYTIIMPDEGEGWVVVTRWRCYDGSGPATQETSMQVMATDEELLKWVRESVLMIEEGE
jgi:hypothetical protein